MKIINTILRWYLGRRVPALRAYFENPQPVQEGILRTLLRKNAATEWGRKYDFSRIKNKDEYRQKLPISRYEDFAPYVERMLRGEPNVLYTGLVKNFSKSSGTTNDKSKFIPVSQDALHGCHLKASLDSAAWWYEQKPHTQWLANSKGLIMGGTWSLYNEQPRIVVGDVSALMMQNMPFYAKFMQAPDLATALLPDWEEKIARMVRYLAATPNLTSISGVPTWTLVLLRALLDYTGKKNALELFPRMEVYMHGGVDFAPYRSQFEALFPSSEMQYRNIYNASEGFFAAQIDNSMGSDDMLMYMDNGIFFEFLPLADVDNPQAATLTVDEVQTGTPYALIISTNAGLWRYMVGDVVEFTSLRPHKIRVAGRTQQFLNVFGEEVMVSNTDKAIALTAAAHNAQIADYTVAPIFLQEGSKGGHEWLVEFRRPPANIAAFAADLDLQLQQLNSDYEAKRAHSIALQPLQLHALAEGTFNEWMRSRGKLGGQNKVPRLSSSRRYVEQILAFSKAQQP